MSEVLVERDDWRAACEFIKWVGQHKTIPECRCDWDVGFRCETCSVLLVAEIELTPGWAPSKGGGG